MRTSGMTCSILLYLLQVDGSLTQVAERNLSGENLILLYFVIIRVKQDTVLSAHKGTTK